MTRHSLVGSLALALLGGATIPVAAQAGEPIADCHAANMPKSAYEDCVNQSGEAAANSDERSAPDATDDERGDADRDGESADDSAPPRSDEYNDAGPDEPPYGEDPQSGERWGDHDPGYGPDLGSGPDRGPPPDEDSGNYGPDDNGYAGPLEEPNEDQGGAADGRDRDGPPDADEDEDEGDSSGPNDL